MKKIIKNSIREIITKEYNQIDMDSYEYLEFENLIIQEILHDGYIQEGFNKGVIRNRIITVLENMKNKHLNN